MKLLALLVPALFAVSASATSPMAPMKPLTHVEVDGRLMEKHVAYVSVNEGLGTMTFRVEKEKGVEVENITVKYTVKEDCGSKIYSGVLDQRPVDGLRYEVEITDHSQRVCENVIEGLTVVHAKLDFPRGGSQTIYAYGNEKLCVFAASGDEAIYNALNVEEVALNPGIAGVGRFQKTAGRLVCLKETIIVPPFTPKYRCSLK